MHPTVITQLVAIERSVEIARGARQPTLSDGRRRRPRAWLRRRRRVPAIALAFPAATAGGPDRTKE